MGNFYSNVVVPNADPERVVAVVEGLKRRAFIAGAGRATFIYDAQCDAQDLAVIEELTRAVSSSCGTALGVCNHDDDVFWYILARDGRVIDSYNSAPGYFDGEQHAPTGGDAALLTDSFGVPGARERVHGVLHDTEGGGGLAIQQHEEICQLLELPTEPAILGYRYVSQGDLAGTGDITSLLGVGGAELPPDQRGTPPSAKAGPPAAGKDAAAPPLGRTRPSAESLDRFQEDCLALERAEIEPDERFAPVLGTGRMNAWLAMKKIDFHIRRHALGVPGDPLRVRCDALLAELLGVAELSMTEMPSVLQKAFGIPSLTADELRLARDRTSALGKEVEERKRSLHLQYMQWIVTDVGPLVGPGKGSEMFRQMSAFIEHLKKS